ncbi:transposase [Bacteroidia bacterium]|nr:transposase [Bacteroidia bacterium]GHU83994.1 transposase [Bacteroidia bacterium]GHV10278.1 transposase [Bacteroidia bacterium]GHV71329.1 transposase [Bacteroidia bacterium]
MKKAIFILSIVLFSFTAQVKAQFVVTDPANIATSIVNSANQIVQTSSTVSNVIKNFQEVQKLYNQGKEYYDKLKAIHDLVKDAKKVRDAILLVGEIGDIYVNSFQKMLSDPNFRYEELVAISNGYTVLLQESSNMLLEMKDVVNINGLSMTDHERMDIINYVYDRLKSHRNLVDYYTRKNISISYLRAKKAGESDRVVALYGNSNDRYW